MHVDAELEVLRGIDVDDAGDSDVQDAIGVEVGRHHAAGRRRATLPTGDQRLPGQPQVTIPLSLGDFDAATGGRHGYVQHAVRLEVADRQVGRPAGRYEPLHLEVPIASALRSLA